jgi:hypothetical protein
MSSNQQPEVVLVTGAAGGVGRAITHALAERGAHIGLLAGGPEPPGGVRRENGSLGGRGSTGPADVAGAGQSRAWITMVQLPGVNAPQFNWCDSKLPQASAFPFLLPASGPGAATHPSPALKLRQEPRA